MTHLKIASVTLLLVVALTVVAAQNPQRRPAARRPVARPTPSATPAATPQPTPAPVDPTAKKLAVVLENTITTVDIQDRVTEAVNADGDPYLRAFYADREQAIKEARQRALDARINSMLAAAAAKKRGMSTDDFLDSEVNSRIPPLTEAEIKAAYDANRAQIGNADLETVRPTLVTFLRGQRSEQLYGDLINRLKMTNTVIKHTDVNTPNLPPGTVLAAVNGEPIRVESINERMKNYVYKMESRIFDIEKAALDRRINDLLFIAEAKKRQVGSEVLVRTEITDKIKPATEAEIANFYNEHKSQINGDLAANRAGIASYLEQQQQERLETDLANRLRVAAKVQVFLRSPVPPVMSVNPVGPARGDASAAVTIVEFTDFQCHACGGMYPVLEEVLKSYGTRVRFVVRDFPLTRVHPNAFKAAQAAAAADAQGKFWEYIDLLFKNQDSLDDATLKKFATQVGLDRKRFDTELDSGKYVAEIRRDMEDGETYGIDSTPTIFINGVMLLPSEWTPDGIRAAIDRAFKHSPR